MTVPSFSVRGTFEANGHVLMNDIRSNDEITL
jgi:hypothetical protein